MSRTTSRPPRQTDRQTPDIPYRFDDWAAI